MYTREITSPPEKIVQNGKPVFGTFNKPFKLLDIRGVKHPFGDLPFPQFITNMRIRASLTFAFITAEYIGIVDFFDAKLFGWAEVVLWNLSTAQKYVYRKLMGPRRRLVPKSLEAAACISFSRKRYIRISWNRSQNRFSVLLNMKGSSVFPPLSAAFTLDTLAPDFAQMASVQPAPILRRCSALYQLTAPLRGSFSLAPGQGMPASPGIGYFNIMRTYLEFRSKYDSVTGIGFIDGAAVTFKLSSSSHAAVDEDTYNDNVLFVAGKTIPLPPVVITRPDGIAGPWIIQDTESMVDLTFRPLSDNQRKLSAFIIRTENHTMFGRFEGMLATGEGEALSVNGFTGIGKKNRSRM